MDYKGAYNDVTEMLLRVQGFTSAVRGTIFEQTSYAEKLRTFEDDCNDFLNSILMPAWGKSEK